MACGDEPDRPTADTLLSVLTGGLNTTYRVRRDMLGVYGNRVPWEPQAAREIEEARKSGDAEVPTATWPTHFMDDALRIRGWNRYFPRFIGRAADDPAIERFIGPTHFEIPVRGMKLCRRPWCSRALSAASQAKRRTPRAQR